MNNHPEVNAKRNKGDATYMYRMCGFVNMYIDYIHVDTNILLLLLY